MAIGITIDTERSRYEYDEDLINKYLSIIASFVGGCVSVERIMRQYYFVSKILCGSQSEKRLSEIITDAELVDIKEFEIIGNELKDEISLLLIDILMMISMDGEIEE